MKKRIIAIFLITALLLMGCKSKGTGNTDIVSAVTATPEASIAITPTAAADESDAAEPTKSEESTAPSNNGNNDHSTESAPTETVTIPDNSPADSPDSASTPETTPEEASPETTDTPGTPEEPVDVISGTEDTVNPYDKFVGYWYLYSTEVDGDYSLATESGCMDTLFFYEDEPSVTRITKYIYDTEEDTIIWTSKNVTEVTDGYYGDYMLHADYSENGNYIFTPDDLEGFEYFFDEDGNLVEYYIVYYDGEIPTGVWTIYTREAPDFSGSSFEEYLPHELPSELQELIYGAADNEALLFITNPSEELWNECVENGWKIQTPPDNSDVAPFVNPQNVIIANCSDVNIDFEVHEPASDYDPSTSETEWVPGPFMYWANLEPGEIFCFVGDVAETAIEARQAVYMTFEDEPDVSYYLRLFHYDIPTYITR